MRILVGGGDSSSSSESYEDEDDEDPADEEKDEDKKQGEQKREEEEEEGKGEGEGEVANSRACERDGEHVGQQGGAQASNGVPEGKQKADSSEGLNKGPTGRKVKKPWAFDDDWDVSGFEAEVPNPALTYAFELDPFQKRAVRRIERSEHTLVCAHTSAGKTVVAEYAIAHAMRNGLRAIYTSPIKALSNQKFREFTKRFEGIGTIGIVTGDVAVNPDASCIIVTTEILRSMLYRRDKGLDTVKWVIFDEVHYINDVDRGVVWEEVIILLPQEVSMVMLSATVPNYQEFAGWVGRTKRKPVYTIHTLYRPTPLRHFLVFNGRTLPILDSEGFHSEAFTTIKEMLEEKKKAPMKKWKAVRVRFESRPFGMTPYKAGGYPIDADPTKPRPATAYIVEKVNSNDPSKPAWKLGVRPGWVLTAVNGKELAMHSLEEIQQAMREAVVPCILDFDVPPKDKAEKQKQKEAAKPTTRESRERAETQRLQTLLRQLEEEDLLPATVFVFSRRRVESLGSDMPHLDLCTPAEKSKVHIFLKTAFERLTEADQELPQVQMILSLAVRGVGVHHGGLLPLVKEAVEIMFSRGLIKVLIATETFAMGVNMPSRSVIFTSWMKHDGMRLRQLLPSEYTQMAGRAGRRGLDAEGRVFLLCGQEPPSQTQLREVMTKKADRLGSRFRVTFAMILQLSQRSMQVEDVMGSSFAENARAAGLPTVKRHIRKRREELSTVPHVRCIYDSEPAPIEEYAIVEEEARRTSRGLNEFLLKPTVRDKVLTPGRVLLAWKDPGFASSPAVFLGPGADPGTKTLRILVLLQDGSCDGESDGEEPEDLIEERIKLEGNCSIGLCEVSPQGILQAMDQVLDLDPARESGDWTGVGQELLRMVSGGLLAPLSLQKVMKVDLTAHDLELKLKRVLQLQEQSICHSCHLRSRHFQQNKARADIAADIEDLERQLGSGSLHLLPQLKAREAVLKELSYINGDGVVTLKGRAAIEVLSGDELTIAEIVFHNIFDTAGPREVAAAVSAFVFPDKVDEESEDLKLPPPLAKLRDAMLAHHHRIDVILRKYRVDIDPEEYSKMCNIGLMGIAYRWASGEALAKIMPETWLQEGTIVRAIVRAEELLKKLGDVAKLLGNMRLREVFLEAALLIHRDIAFVPSLYIEL